MLFTHGTARASAVKKAKSAGSGDDTNHRLEVILEPETEYQIDANTGDGQIQTQSYRTTREQRQRVNLEL